MVAYYNEIDPDAVAVLRQCIADGVIAPGEVDTRSIKEVQADDLRGFMQCHFFAGGGLWSVAARMAGWPDSRPLWTGSCPCQPFSAAGKGAGVDDPRHLWPDLFRLVRDASAAGFGPAVLMGEQVSGAAGYAWFDGVRADLAGEGFASRTRDIPACAVDAPHQRNRLYWIAVADREGCTRRTRLREARSIQYGSVAANVDGQRGVQPDADCGRRPWWTQGQKRKTLDGTAPERLADGVFADAHQPEFQRKPPARQQPVAQPHARSLRNGSWWAEAEWVVSPLDGKSRRTKPGLPFLVDGLPGRVGLWRVGGNAISPVLAAEVIGAFLDAEEICAREGA